MIGVIYFTAILHASYVVKKQSPGVVAAITGVGASPFLPYTA